jgi:hypothetical protein
VVRKRADLQPREDVTHLGPFEEGRSLLHLVRDSDLPEGVLEGLTLRIQSIEDGELRPLAPARQAAADVASDVARLLLLVEEHNDPDHLAGAGVSPEPLRSLAIDLEMTSFAQARILPDER